MDCGICYLCGLPMNQGKEDIDHDHVVPRRFLPRAVRLEHRVKLIRLQTHRRCNVSLQKDEEYFLIVVPLFARQTRAVRRIRADTEGALSRPEGARIAARLDDGQGLVDSRLEWDRIGRVVVKLSRGLLAHELGEWYPDTVLVRVRLPTFQLDANGDEPPEGVIWREIAAENFLYAIWCSWPRRALFVRIVLWDAVFVGLDIGL